MAYRRHSSLFRMSSTTKYKCYTFNGSYLDDVELREELNAPPDCRVVWDGITFHTTTVENAESILRDGPIPQETEIAGTVFGFYRQTQEAAFWCSAIPLDIPREATISHLEGQELVTLGVKVSWNDMYRQMVWDTNWPCLHFAFDRDDVESVCVLEDWKQFRSPEALERLERLR